MTDPAEVGSYLGWRRRRREWLADCPIWIVAWWSRAPEAWPGEEGRIAHLLAWVFLDAVVLAVFVALAMWSAN